MYLNNTQSLILYSFVFIVSLSLIKKYEFSINGIEQKISVSYKRYVMYILVFILLFGFPIILSSIRYNVGTDFHTYEEMYMVLRDDGFVFSSYPVEFGYKFLCLISSLIWDNSQSVILITSILPFALIYIGWIKNKNLSLFSIFFIYYAILFGLGLNNVRQAIAISFIIVGFMILVNKSEKINKLYYLIIVIIASSFHATALICLVFLLFTKESIDFFKSHKKYIFYVIIILIITAFSTYVCGFFDVYLQRYHFQFSFNYKHFLLRVSINLPLIWYLYNNRNKCNYKFYIFIFLLELFFWLTTIFYAWSFRFAYYCIPAHMFVLDSLLSNKAEDIKMKLCKIYIMIWYPFYFILVYYFLLNDGIFPYYTMLFKYL